MRLTRNNTACAAVSVLAAAGSPATAGDYLKDGDVYVSLSGAAVFQQDSDNEGVFPDGFTTGAGASIPAGTALPAGSAVGWSTEFNTGFATSGAVGFAYRSGFRSELEVSYQEANVDAHTGVSAAGIDLSAEDAGVLITGSNNIGVNVADLVADGQGELNALYVMANVYYDFKIAGRVTPYVGGGVGVAFANVDYVPSGVSIIEDDQTAFAYQLMAGLTVPVAPRVDAFVGYRYRATEDLDARADLFVADFEIENRASQAEAGFRVRF
ncbi:MAG: P44/Msp2 family outer membrane protein [Pseudomonadota bacterium]